MPRNCASGFAGEVESLGGRPFDLSDRALMVLIRWQFKTLLCNRCSLWWVDNDAARFLYHKGLESQPYHERYGPGILRHGLSAPNLQLD